MNPFTSDQPFAIPIFLGCCWLAIWGNMSASCANSEKEICNQWRGAMTKLTEVVGSGKETVGTELNDLAKEK